MTETEYVLRIPLDRHVINTRRPFAAVIEDVRSRIGRKADGTPAAVRLVSPGEFDIDGDCGSAGLPGSPGEPVADHMVRLLVDVPAATGELIRFLPDAGASCPVTILIHELAAGGARLVYDSVASAVSAYQDDDSLAVARLVDAEILALLRRVATGR